MKADNSNIELRQDAFRGYSASALVPDTLLVDIEVADGVPLLRKVRDNRMPGLKRHLVLS